MWTVQRVSSYENSETIAVCTTREMAEKVLLEQYNLVTKRIERTDRNKV